MAQMKKKTTSNGMKTSAASHQRSLAKMSGDTAARDKAAKMEKAKNTFGIMDQTGAAKGKAEKKALKSFGLKSEPYKAAKKAAAKPAARSKAGASTVSAVAKRFGVTAREARDIATAVGTLSQTRKTSAGGTKEEARKNLKQQIKEVGAAAAKGKKGTTSKEYNPTFSIMTVGKKRK
jgi:hypothetical protein